MELNKITDKQWGILKQHWNITPENLKRKGDIDLYCIPDSHLDELLNEDGELALPDGLEITTSFDAYRLQIKKFPKNLTVGGYVDISNTEIIEIPEGLKLGRSLYLANNNIKKLPDNLTIKGGLALNGTFIEELPKNLSVNDLNICYTKIKSIPADIKISGSLYAQECELETLPDNLHIGTTLQLKHSKVTKLPNGLVVGNDFIIDFTKITEIPKDITLLGDISAEHSELTTLPDNLIIGGHAWLKHTNISKLPKNLVVGKNINVRHTQITELPEDLKVYGDIRGPQLVDLTEGIGIDEQQNGAIYVETDRYIITRNNHNVILVQYKKKKELSEGMIVYTTALKDRNVVLLDNEYVSDEEELKECIAEVLYKRARDIGDRQYKNLTKDSVLTVAEARTMYRIITGACQTGTKEFIDNLGDNIQETYTVRLLLVMTDNESGGTIFRDFIEANEECITEEQGGIKENA